MQLAIVRRVSRIPNAACFLGRVVLKTISSRAIATCGAMLCLAVLSARAQAATDYDPFDYSGTALNGQNGGTGWSGGWFTTTSTDNTLSNDGVSLSYPATFELPMTVPATSGSRVSTGGLSAIASTSRLLSQTIPLNVDGTVRYASALFRKNRANGSAADNVLLEFVDSGANRRWGVGIEGAGDKPWLNANGSTSAATAVTPGDTYFIVTKIVSSATGSDQAFLKVFGTSYGSQVPLAEPTTWDATLSETTSAILDRVRVRIDNANLAASPGEVDEIRVSTTWLGVIGSSPTIGDWNGDGTVDAADYVKWRSDPNSNGGDPAGYNAWRASFGNTITSGSGSSLGAASVPEPTTVLLSPMAAAILLLATRRRAKLAVAPARGRPSR